MSMATRVAPIAVAGVAGILVGYLMAPDVSAVREDFAARFNEQTPLLQALQASVAGMEARMATLPDATSMNASIQEQLSATEGRLATQSEALGDRIADEGIPAPEELTAGLDALRGDVDEFRARIESLTAEMAAMREEAADRAEESPEPDAAEALASEIGASGAVLLPGQGAIFGGTRVGLTALDIDAGSATLQPDGGEPADLAAGDTVELSASCTIRLAGIAANAAYLAPEACLDPAPAEPSGEAAAPAEPADGAAVP